MFGYSHLTGGYQGGQADFVRVPIGAPCGAAARARVRLAGGSGHVHASSRSHSSSSRIAA
jgi:hypothetical protein